jgi:hypothetical protein
MHSDGLAAFFGRLPLPFGVENRSIAATGRKTKRHHCGMEVRPQWIKNIIDQLKATSNKKLRLDLTKMLASFSTQLPDVAERLRSRQRASIP